MTTELATKPTVSPEKYDLVKEQFARGCTDNEFQVFLELANRYQLDPFARQIWAVKGYGSSPAQIMIARDGYLAVAHRSGQFDGMSDPEYETDEKGKVIHVRIRVYRKDMAHPFTGDAWDDEDNLHQSVWNKRQRTMLLKVAESRALRKAFSISGTYCPEELGYDDNAPYKIDPKPSDIKVENIKPAIPPMSTGTTTSTTAKTYTVRDGKAVEAGTVPEPIKTIATYPAFQIKSIMDNFQSWGYNMDVFAKAQLPNGDYDKEMIDADYRKQMASEKTSDPSPKQTKPEPEHHDENGLQQFTAEVIKEAEHKRTIDQPFCVDCGNTRVLPSEEKESRAKYGVALCPKCLSKRLADDLKQKQEAKALEDAGKEALQNLVNASKKAASISKPADPMPEPKQTKPAKPEAGCCSVCGKKMTKGELSKWMLFNPDKAPVCSDCANKKE